MTTEAAVQPLPAQVTEVEPLIPTIEKKSALSCCGIFKSTTQREPSEFDQTLRRANVSRAAIGFVATVVGTTMLAVDIVQKGNPAWGVVGALLGVVGSAVAAGSIAANCKRSHP